jgi:hypothetical protein
VAIGLPFSVITWNVSGDHFWFYTRNSIRATISGQIQMDRSYPFLTGYNFQPHSHLNWSCGFGLRAVPPQCGHFIAQTAIISTSYSVRI